MKRRTLLPLLTAAPFVPTAAGHAQPAPAGPAWSPDHPLRFIVGFAPGGSTDTTARVLPRGSPPGWASR